MLGNIFKKLITARIPINRQFAFGIQARVTDAILIESDPGAGAWGKAFFTKFYQCLFLTFFQRAGIVLLTDGVALFSEILFCALNAGLSKMVNILRTNSGCQTFGDAC